MAVSCGGDGEGEKSGGTKKAAPTYAYICPNGTPAAGTTSAPNTVKCNSCGTNYVEENDECLLDSDNDGVANIKDVDNDNDGLIEINDATEMGYIQFNLAGTSLDDEADDSAGNGGDTRGAQAFSNHTANAHIGVGLGVRMFAYTTTKHPCAPEKVTTLGWSANSATSRTITLRINNVTKIFTCSKAGGVIPIVTIQRILGQKGPEVCLMGHVPSSSKS